MLAAALVDGVWRHLTKLNAGLQPLTDKNVLFDLVYAGDVYSQSGADFIERCAQLHSEWMVSLEGLRGDQLVEKSLRFEARW